MTALEEALIRSETRVSGFRSSTAIERRGDSNSLASMMMQSPLFRSPWSGRYDRTPWHKRDQFDHFTGTTWTIIRLLANRLAGQPIRVGRIPRHRGGKSVPMRKQFPMGFLPPSFKHLQTEIEFLPQHPIYGAMAKPNDCMVFFTLMFVTVAGLEICGDVYWWMDQDEDGNYQIWPIPSHWIEPVHSEKHGLFCAYRVGTLEMPVSAKIVVPAKQIIPFRLPNPADPFDVISPMQAMARAVSVDHAMEIAAQAGFVNGANPGLAFIVGRPPELQGLLGNAGSDQWTLSQDQRSEFTNWLKQRYAGFMRNEEPLILDGLIRDVKRVTNTPRELDFQGSMPLIEQRLFEAWGVNPFSAGRMEVSSRAASAVADDHLIVNALKPRTELISQTLTRWMPPFFGEDDSLHVIMETPRSYDAEFELNKTFGMFDRDALDVNELRAAWDYPPMARQPIRDNGRAEQDDDDDEDSDTVKGRKGHSLVPMWPNWAQYIGRWAINREKGWSVLKVARTVEAMLHAKFENVTARALRSALRPLFDKAAGRAERLAEKFNLEGKTTAHLANLIWNRGEAEKALAPVLQEAIDRGMAAGLKFERHNYNEQKRSRRRLRQKHQMEPMVAEPTIAESFKRALKATADRAKEIAKGVVNWIFKKVRAAVAGAVIATGGDVNAAVKAIPMKVFTKRVEKDVSNNVARESMTAALNHGRSIVIRDKIKAGEVKTLTWNTKRDERVRDTHWECQGQEMDANGKFHVGGFECDYPGDPKLPPKERCQCRCSVLAVYHDKPNKD